MTELSPKRSNLKNMREFPWQWAVYALCIAVGFLFNKLGKSKDQEKSDCTSDVKMWQGMYMAKAKDLDNLKDQMMIKVGIIDRVATKADSLLKESAINQNQKSN